MYNLKYVIRIVCLLLTIPLLTKAQTNTVDGYVLAAENNEPLPGATIFITHRMDSTFESAMISDSLGYFAFDNVQKGLFSLSIQFVGFENLDNEIYVDGSLKLGNLTMNPSPLLLDQITVTANKSRLTHSFDKKVYSVSEDLFAQSGSATDILQNIPSLNVDIDGAISLRNSWLFRSNRASDFGDMVPL